MVFIFRDFCFPVNPQTVEIERGARVRTELLAGGGYLLGERSPGPTVIRGSGVFTGSGAARDFGRLRGEYLRGGSGVLILGTYGSLDAVLRALTCTGRQGDSVGYAFEFVEFPVERAGASRVVHTVGVGETLWEIADLHGVTVEHLLAINPSLCAPDAVTPGGEVFVC